MVFVRFCSVTTTLFLFDALGLGLFTIIGIELALTSISAQVFVLRWHDHCLFWGVIRDVLLNDVPLLFRKEIYAMACIAGGSVYLLLKNTSLDVNISKIVCILLIFIIRVLAVRYKLSLPRFYEGPKKAV
jgi:uncharacterized membrane protein YeiH